MIERHQLPDNWSSGIGEGTRPLSDGGYYRHFFYKSLPGSNQHVRRFLEIMVDTVDMPPSDHYVELAERRSDDHDTWEVRRIDSRTIEVEDPNDEESQEEAEERAFEKALELMEEHS